MPSWCWQVNWGNCGTPLEKCAVLRVKDDWKGQFWGLSYCLSKLRSLLSFFRQVWRHTEKLLSLTESVSGALRRLPRSGNEQHSKNVPGTQHECKCFSVSSVREQMLKKWVWEVCTRTKLLENTMASVKFGTCSSVRNADGWRHITRHSRARSWTVWQLAGREIVRQLCNWRQCIKRTTPESECWYNVLTRNIHIFKSNIIEVLWGRGYMQKQNIIKPGRISSSSHPERREKCKAGRTNSYSSRRLTVKGVFWKLPSRIQTVMYVRPNTKLS